MPFTDKKEGASAMFSSALNTLLLVANYPSDVGYAWWLMESFWAKLAEHYSGFNQVILTYPKIERLPEIIHKAPMQCVEFDFSGMSFRRIYEQCRFLRRNRVRAIYFTDKPTFHWLYGIYRFCGVKLIIVHDHTPGLRNHSNKALYVLKRIISRLPYINIDGALGATDFVRRRLIEINCVTPERAFAVPNGLPGLNTQPKPANLHDLFQIPSERKIVIMVARANRYKGIDFILNCFKCLSQGTRKQVHFLFVGDGPDIARFVASANQMGIAGNCTFAGKRNDVPSLLEGADIAFHPSSGEVGYSLSILEYMRAGLPLIVPDNPSVCGATIDGVSGFIYPVGDIHFVVRLLERLINDNILRNKIGSQAREAARHYNLETTHSHLINAFETIDRNKILRNSKAF